MIVDFIVPKNKLLKYWVYRRPTHTEDNKLIVGTHKT